MQQTEEISRWSVGEAFTEALMDAANAEATVTTAMEPVRRAMDEFYVSLCDEVRDRMADALNDEVRARTDKIIEALLQGDERLLGSFMAAGGYREPNIGWDGTFRSGYWVDVRRKIVEANEAILRNERIADLTAERDALSEELKKVRIDLAQKRGELAETKEALNWANVRAGAGTEDAR